MSSQDETLSQDLVFNILSSPRRRYVLYFLREHSGQVELSTLSSRIAAWENQTSVDELTDQERKRVYVSLYQTHIPKLQEVGLVEYDKQSGVVTLTDRVGEIDEYLRTDESSTFRWDIYYLVLAVVAGIIIAGKWLAVAPFAAVPATVLAGLIILGFGLSALAHFSLQRRSSSSEIPPELRAREN